ncbi:SMP-30/gluconolactonase/LRE family protein [Nocardioides mangrovicus]|uniref:SMP-30/gluconolactonase/LRE family protein n=2 Tax=Nocardioides mangrovicus TaxID=2478913 RepID=A0A3L8P4Y9_9ACTN|nr:SMP-30/gluconolactonase/LRE family protein [Nocardioides mangrovicus]
MGESPRWHDGRLWVCDWLAGEVISFDDHGSSRVEARVEGLPFSIDWLPDGRLVLTSPAGVLVGPELAVHGAAGQPFNEIVVDAAGRAWVDMPGSRPGEPRRPGVVAVVLPDGSSRQVADDVWFPNGMAILEDTTLLVAESHADRITAWRITDEATLVERRVWAELGAGEAPDGICIDADGALWYASVPGRHCVRVAEGGRVLATLEADRGCFSCVLGGPDGTSLFVVANEYSAAGASDGVVLTEQVAVGRP